MELVCKVRELLGTEVWINVVGKKFETEKAIEKAFEEGWRIEKAYSRFLHDNDLAELNSLVGKWVKVSPEMFELIRFGCDIYKKTDGAFDLTVKNILENWGYDARYSLRETVLNNEGELKRGIVELGENDKVRINMEIDLGGLGKGYAVDQMVRCLCDFENFFVNAGGDIFAKGCDLSGENWKVFFEHPSDPEQVIGSVTVDNFALACSSPTKHKWGNKHHLVDSRIQAPANQMLAVYTQALPIGRQAGNCLLADAYATALFVLGYRKAREKLANFPVEAMLVDVTGEIYKTKKFRGELFA